MLLPCRVAPFTTMSSTKPQAILDLETATISSSLHTVGITATTTASSGDVVTATEDGTMLSSTISSTTSTAPSSWLRGFLKWVPSSVYSSYIFQSDDGDDNDHGYLYTRSGDRGALSLWNSTEDSFHTALAEFLAEPGNGRRAKHGADVGYSLYGNALTEQRLKNIYRMYCRRALVL